MKHLAILFFVLSSLAANSQTIFYENFNGGIPSNWTLVNGDNNTPANQVAYFDNAWNALQTSEVKVRQVPGIAHELNDSAAVSNSWYNPAGTSDDWLISPAIQLPQNAELLWSAAISDPDFPDAYEVRISTASSDTSDFLANPPLVVINPESWFWQKRSVDLSAAGYGGQTVYLAWRNISNDKYLVALDEIYVNNIDSPYDVSVASYSGYGSIPARQAPMLPFHFVASNTGSAVISNVSLDQQVHYFPQGSIVNQGMTSGLSLMSAETDTTSIIGVSLAIPGDYVVSADATIDETDQDASNNHFSVPFSITDSIYARETGHNVSLFTTGQVESEWANTFDIYVTDTLSSVRFYTQNDSSSITGKPTICSVYQMDPVTGMPGNLIAASTPIPHPAANQSWVKISMGQGGVELTPGKYLISVKVNGGVYQTSASTSNSHLPVTWYRDSVTGWTEHTNTDAAGIRATFKPFNPVASVQEEGFGTSFSIAPNPTNGIATLSLGKIYDKVQLTILAADGRLIEEKTISNISETTLNFGEVSGVYFVKVEVGGSQYMMHVINR